MATMSLQKIRGQLDMMKERHKRHIEHAKRGFTALGDTAVVSSSAALCGYVQGRYGGYKIFGMVPFELALGAGFHAAGIFGPNRMRHQMHNLGNGAVGAYVTATARGFGRQARAKAGEKPLLQGVSEGLDELLGEGTEGGGALSTADLIKMAERM